MTGGLIVLAVLAAVALIVVVAFVGIYNGLVALRNEARNAWAHIDVQLKRRHDLIPNLVETVRGYMKHERETLESVVNARARAIQAQTPADSVKAEADLTGALGRLLVVVEQYPDLKASANFQSLQGELANTENAIGAARHQYNAAVTVYNTRTQTVPANIIAGLFGFQPMPLFEVTVEAEREAPKVKF